MEELTFKQFKRKYEIHTKEKCVEEYLINDTEDTCWGHSVDKVLEYAREYQVLNGRTFAEKYAREGIIKIDNLFVLFDYSNCYEEI